MFRHTLPALLSLSVPFAVAAEPAKLSYSKDIAPILNASCAGCHRPGQMAPMSLLTYDEVRPWVKAIRENVSAGKMPPWHAVAHAKPFNNDRSLSQEQLDTIVAWIDQGAPRGNPTDLPPAPDFPEGEWKLGKPDLVVTLPEIEIPADGPDIFQKVPGKVALPENRWISAVEILPGETKVVHHVIVVAIKGFDADPEDGWMGAWAAGTEPMVFPEGTGRQLEAGANIIADMHWHPSGTAVKDQTRIGLHFAENKDIQKELVNLWIVDDDWTIPAGDPNFEVRARYTFPQDAFVMAFAPHMHYRGKDFTYTAKYPDGREEVLLRVENYDFNWQTNYVLSEKLPIPKGTTIECVARFDNSADNPVNPDPTRNVTFGEETNDEMMIGFLDYIVADGVRPKTRQELYAEAGQAWNAAHPSEVYGVTNPRSNVQAPLYLPRSGEGRMMLTVNGTPMELALLELTWSGDTFTARVPASETLEFQLEGTLDRATGKVTAKLFREGMEGVTFTGGAWTNPVKSAS